MGRDRVSGVIDSIGLILMPVLANLLTFLSNKIAHRLQSINNQWA
jgi:hypothetical protein